MNILVSISKTPETTAKISFTSDQKAFDSSGVQYIMNPYDEWYALVRAVELKEKHGGKVIVVNVGPASNDVIIRKALAIGADEAVRINKEANSAYDAAQEIATYATDKGFDLLFFGKETIDYNGSEVGPMVAEFLQLPFVSYASGLEIEGNISTITRDIEGGVEVVEVEGPCVVSCAKGMAEQRIPNMRGIMMAKRKPLSIVEPSHDSQVVSVAQFELPPAKGGVTLVDPEDMDELVRLLHEEAKVI